MKQHLTKVNTGFTQVTNTVILDKKLSLADKGLYAYLYSKPDDWDFAASRIAKELGVGEKLVMKCLKNLELAGYLVRTKQQSGRTDYLLAIFATSPNGSQPNGLPAESGTISNTKDTSNIEDINNTIILASTPSSARNSKSSSKDKVKKEVILANKEGVQSLLTYFYMTLLPGAPKIFSPTNRKALDGLITAHGLKDVRDTIDKAKSLLGVQYAPQISNISVFATKYLTIKNYQAKSGYQPVRHF